MCRNRLLKLVVLKEVKCLLRKTIINRNLKILKGPILVSLELIFQR